MILQKGRATSASTMNPHDLKYSFRIDAKSLNISPVSGWNTDVLELSKISKKKKAWPTQSKLKLSFPTSNAREMGSHIDRITARIPTTEFQMSFFRLSDLMIHSFFLVPTLM